MKKRKGGSWIFRDLSTAYGPFSLTSSGGVHKMEIKSQRGSKSGSRILVEVKEERNRIGVKESESRERRVREMWVPCCVFRCFVQSIMVITQKKKSFAKMPHIPPIFVPRE